jgi:hypothetical protein
MSEDNDCPEGAEIVEIKDAPLSLEYDLVRLGEKPKPQRKLRISRSKPAPGSDECVEYWDIRVPGKPGWERDRTFKRPVPVEEFPTEVEAKHLKVPADLVNALLDIGPWGPYDNNEDVQYYDWCDTERQRLFNKLCAHFGAVIPMREVNGRWEPCRYASHQDDFAWLTIGWWRLNPKDWKRGTTLCPEGDAWRKLALGLVERYCTGLKKPPEPIRTGGKGKQKALLIQVARLRASGVVSNKEALKKLNVAGSGERTLTRAISKFVPDGEDPWYRWVLANLTSG